MAKRPVPLYDFMAFGALYIMHLVYSYSLIALIIAGLIYYSVKSSKVYRVRYTIIVVTILVFVAISDNRSG